MRGCPVCVNEHTEKIINAHFKTNGLPFEAMRDFQRNLRRLQLQARHKLETDRIDERMKAVKILPKDFDEWINEVVLNFSRYIYYKRKTKRLIEGFCTLCRSRLELLITPETPHEKVRHNEKGKCPVCEKAITFKAVGKTKKQVDEAVAAYIQKTKSGFMVRLFKVIKRYFEHYENPSICTTEYVRDFCEQNSEGVWHIKSFEYNYFKQTNKLRWCHSLNTYNMDTACLYTRSLRQVLANTCWKYSGIYELAKNMDRFNVYGYLNAYKAHPAYEYLVKLRLYRLVAENAVSYTVNNCRLNFEGKGFDEVLGINREQLNQMQRINGTYSHMKMIREIGQPLTDGQIEQLVEMGFDGTIFSELLSYTTAHKIINYTVQCAQGWKPAPYEMSKYRTIAGQWRDYLDNCNLLDYDIKDDFILFPRDLKAAHDNVMEQYKHREDDIRDKAIADMYAKLLEHYGFGNKTYLVRPPATTEEIVAEGHTLHHCVHTGSYISKMIKGKLTILFIRRTEQPDEPFYTAEVVDGMLTQCRGANNCDMTEDVKKFVAVWKKKKLHHQSV
jgi:hypothetical protein